MKALPTWAVTLALAAVIAAGFYLAIRATVEGL